MTLLRRILQWLIRRAQAFYNWLDEKPDATVQPHPAPEQEADAAPGDGQVIATPEFNLATTEVRRYVKRKAVLTSREDELFRKLVTAVGHDYQIFAKMRLSDVMELQNKPTDEKYHYNQIGCKHFDFVLCHFKSTEPLLAIEVLDDSHTLFNSIQSDNFKRQVCAEVGLPLLWVDDGVRLTTAQLAREIHAKIGQSITSA